MHHRLDSANSEFSRRFQFISILDSSIFGNSNCLKTDAGIRVYGLIIKRARGEKYPRDRYSWRDGISPLKPKIWWMAAKWSEVEPCPFGVFSAGRVTQSISRSPLSLFPSLPVAPLARSRDRSIPFSRRENLKCSWVATSKWSKGTSGDLFREEASVMQLLSEGEKKFSKSDLATIFKWLRWSSEWSSMLIVSRNQRF